MNFKINIINKPATINRNGFVDIKGFEGLYMINRKGEIISIGRQVGTCKRHDKLVSPQRKPNGYMIVHLYKDNKMTNHYVHRLVANAFIPNTNNFPQINHKDENRENNNVDNLEWCNNSYNYKYSHIGDKIAKKRGKKVIAINTKTNEQIEARSINELSRKFNDNAATISHYTRNNKLYKDIYKISFIFKYGYNC